jgi:hypothetical protein
MASQISVKSSSGSLLIPNLKEAPFTPECP